MEKLLLLGFITFLGYSCVFARAEGTSKAMNPDIGANFIIEAEKGSAHASDGFRFREAEFSLKSDVDPYFTANMIFSVSQDSSGQYGITPEEVYVDTTTLPSVTIRAGKFYGAFGKQNQLHTHAYPFIDAPLMSTALLGDGLNSPGVSASVLLPTSFFSEIYLQGFENFRSLAHFRSLFDLSESSTLELGVSGLTKWAYGLDITFKHRPTDRGQGRRFNLAGEWMSGALDGFTTAPTLDGTPTQGFDVYGQYEFLPKTYAQYRFDDLISNKRIRHGVLLGYAPSEFSVMRLQFDRSLGGALASENRVIAQMNFTIGFHPAHEY